MFKLIRSEIYRLLHKKSMFIYFGAMAAGYLLLAFIRSGGFTEGSIVSDANSLFTLLPALAGGFLFSAIYTDDLNSKNLISLVGFGVNKLTIVVAKFVLSVLFGAVVFGIVPIYHCAVYTALGQTATISMAAAIYAASLKHLLAYLAYSALSGVVVYGLQRATFAIVTFILLAFGVVGSLASLALHTFAPNLVRHLVSGITDRILMGMISEEPLIMPVIEYIFFVLEALVLSQIAFYKKEMEF